MAEPEVVIYSTPTCPHCKRAKDYFTEKGIAYLDHNVAEDREKAQEMIQMSGQMGVPVIVIGDEIVVGFDQPLLDKLLSR